MNKLSKDVLITSVVAITLFGCSSLKTCIVSFDSRGGTPVETQHVVRGEKAQKPDDPTRNGYRFVEWQYQGEAWSFVGYTITEDMTLNAVWSDPIVYKINYVLDGGYISDDRPTTYTIESETIDLPTPWKNGYKFDGWEKRGDEIITSIPKGSYGDLTITAKWSPNTYRVIAKSDNEARGTVKGSGYYAYDSIATVTATPNNGYYFVGWYYGPSILISTSEAYSFSVPAGDYRITARFSPFEYTISYALDGGTLDVDIPDKYDVETADIILPTPTKSGYSFAGWQDQEGKIVSSIPTGSYGNIALKAIWSINSYNVVVASNHVNWGKVSGGGTYKYGTSVTVTATPVGDYIFKGWYVDDLCCPLITKDRTYTFTMGGEDISLIARFSSSEEEQQIAYGTIPSFRDDGKTLTYGLYPQTVVSDASLISNLNKLTTANETGYYRYGNEFYAKKVATPMTTTSKDYRFTFSDRSAISERTVYWFKCEPIVWDVLEIDEGTCLLFSDIVLDMHLYSEREDLPGLITRDAYGRICHYYSPFKNSDIRSWLNGDFYNKAFAYDNSAILNSKVDNSAASTGNSENRYDCGYSEDKIYLISVEELYKSSYGFTKRGESDNGYSLRKKKPSDYALASGAFMIIPGSGYSEEYYGHSLYWTRSPNDGGSIRFYHSAQGMNGDAVFASHGVCPVMRIQLP